MFVPFQCCPCVASQSVLVAVYSDVAAGENARDETTSRAGHSGPQCWEVLLFQMPQMLLLNKNGWIILLSWLQLYERVPFMLARPTHQHSMIRKIVFIYRNYILMWFVMWNVENKKMSIYHVLSGSFFCLYQIYTSTDSCLGI